MRLVIQTLDSRDAGFDAALERLLARDDTRDAEVERAVAGIVSDVAARGDRALIEHTNRLDRRAVETAAQLEIDRAALAAALEAVADRERAALERAARRIRSFHERQKESSWSYAEDDGSRYGQIVTPVERVGVYVPGGKAVYPSSVLMNAIPARVAGVSEIVMVAPAPRGRLAPVVLAAAALAGVDRAFTIGGAQAVAALAWGTETVPAVDKIVGPGNRYVAAAKRRVFGRVGIDAIAGPSEVVVICDAGADPEWVALDLFAQAEHDEAARAVLIAVDGATAARVAAAMRRLLPRMERRDVIARALADHGALIVAADFEEAARISNRIAPEHLELQVADAEPLLSKVRHAGAVFAGYYSAEALGDYCAGPNHVLPTSGAARFSSPLGVYDFQKRTSLIACSAAGARALADVAATLADAEGLTAHARAARRRGG